MNRHARAATRALGLLAALHFLSGCPARVAGLREPSQAAARPDLPVTAEERAAFERELAETQGQGPKAARALYFIGLHEYQASRFAEAGKQFLRASEMAGTGWDKASIYMMALSLEKLPDLPRAFVQYQRLLRLPPPLAPAAISPTAQPLPPSALELELDRESRRQLERLIEEGGMGEEELARLIAFPALEEFQPRLRLKRIGLLVAAARPEEAFAAIEDYYRGFPGLPYKDELMRLAKEADKASPVDRRSVGLLLPLSGPQASFGLQAKQGAELMLEEVNARLEEPLKLRYVSGDEGGSPEAALVSAKRLIGEAQVIGVVGPLTSDASASVLPLASSRRTPLLSPGAIRSDLGNAGPYFFRNCMTLEKQGQAMADHALVELKLTRVACLHPDDGYGQALASAFAARVSELAGTVVMSLTYSAGTRDFKDLVVALGGSNPTKLKETEADEKRDQAAKVEALSTKIGRVLLDLKAAAEAASASAEAASDTTGAFASLSFPAKVAVVDFACDSSAARYNMGRAFSDRFQKVLSQLEDLSMLGPEAGARWMAARGTGPESLNPTSAAGLAAGLGADFFLGGSAVELKPNWDYLNEAARLNNREGRQARADIEQFTRNEVFQVTVQLIAARDASVLASQAFEVTKLRPVAPNQLGIQAVYLPGTAAEAVQAASAMKFCEMKAMLLGADKWHRPELLRDSELAGLEDARFTTGFFAESAAGNVRSFVEAYKRRFASPPSLLSAQAYDAAGLMLSQLAGGAATREELRQGLLSLRGWEGVSGRTDFAGRQDAVKRIPILRINSAAQALEQVQ